MVYLLLTFTWWRLFQERLWVLSQRSTFFVKKSVVFCIGVNQWGISNGFSTVWSLFRLRIMVPLTILWYLSPSVIVNLFCHYQFNYCITLCWFQLFNRAFSFFLYDFFLIWCYHSIPDCILHRTVISDVANYTVLLSIPYFSCRK